MPKPKTTPTKVNQELAKEEFTTPTPTEYFIDMLFKSTLVLFKLLAERHHVKHKQALLEMGRMYTVLNVLGDLNTKYMPYVAGLQTRLNDLETHVIHVNRMSKPKLIWARDHVFEPAMIMVDILRREEGHEDTTVEAPFKGARAS
jgi:hypothetical protein